MLTRRKQGKKDWFASIRARAREVERRGAVSNLAISQRWSCVRSGSHLDIAGCDAQAVGVVHNTHKLLEHPLRLGLWQPSPL